MGRAGKIILELYQKGEFTKDDYETLYRSYQMAMMEGAGQGEKNSSAGYGDIYGMSGRHWTPAGMTNPDLMIIRKGILIKDYRDQGLTDSQIATRLQQDQILGGVLAGVNPNNVIDILDNEKGFNRIIMAAAGNIVFNKVMTNVLKGVQAKPNNSLIVENEKKILERIGKNSKNTTNLSQKGANSVYNQQLIRNAGNISTAKAGQQTVVPRDLNEQTFWKEVQSNPQQGKELPGLNNDPRFPISAGFQKMEAKHKLPDGQTITIHYQYNSNTGKAYDMKITTPQRIQKDLKQVVDSIKDSVK